MTLYYYLILELLFIRASSGFLQQNSPTMGGGNIFDTFLQALGVGPTSSPFLDPFSSSNGQWNAFGSMFPLMLSDIDYADHISGKADAIQGQREASQGRDPAPTRNPQQSRIRKTQSGFKRNTFGQQRQSFNQHSSADSNNARWAQLLQNSRQASQSTSTPTSQWMSEKNPQNTRAEVTQKPAVTTTKPSTYLPPKLQLNRLRLSQVLRSSPGQQFKGISRSAISNNELPPSRANKENFSNSRLRSLRDRRPPPPRRPRIDPDLMSDMMDMAGDFGMMGMLMNSMSGAGRGNGCSYSTMAMMEFMLTGRCSYSRFG